MSTRLHTIDLCVTLQAPFLIHGNDPGRLGLDAVLLRDHNGHLVLPGTLLQGRIRHALDALRALGHDMPCSANWFGGPALADSYLPQRARLMVEDLVADANASKASSEPAHRIQIEDITGAVQSGALFAAEQSHAPGASVAFTGCWRAWLADGEASHLHNALLAGILWHSQFGAERSVGFGRLLGATVKVAPLSHARPAGAAGPGPDPGLRRRLVLQVDRPLCVSSESRRGNVFESSDVIPGAALKAALANMLAASRGGTTVAECKGASKLAQCFDALRITHAFPSSCRQRRPSRLPLSLVAQHTPVEILDAASCKVPPLLAEAPGFQIDWKHAAWDIAREEQGWGGVRTDLRVRTAIDATGGRQATDGGLFAYESKVADPGTVWHAEVDLPHGCSSADASAIWAELEALLAFGCGPIGKTDAWATASLQVGLDGDAGQFWPSTVDDIAMGKQVVVQLQTPTLLFPPHAVADHAQVDLQGLYEAAFKSMQAGTIKELGVDSTKESLTFSHFYAAQALSGGEYLWHRFRHRRTEYLPWVLTDAGSVFVFEVRHADLARDVLARWLQGGLPTPDAVKASCGDTWQAQPYVAQNGYGEVAVNMRHPFPGLGADSTGGLPAHSHASPSVIATA